MLGVIFFVLRGSVRCLHFVLRYYCTVSLSKGCALLPFKNGVEIAAVEGVAASIDRHAVPKGQEWPCRDPGTNGATLEPRRDVRDSKNRFRMKITVYFGRNLWAWPAMQDVSVRHFITRSSR